MTLQRIDIRRLVVALVAPFVAAAIGGLATGTSVTTWYPSLNLPSFTPPTWLFGPAWTILYLLMGVSLYLVWRKGLETRASRIAVATFAAQLVLNMIWSVIFFGLRQPGPALVEIVLLWGLIAATIVQFNQLDRLAGWLLVPYIAWTTFATVLNASIWWLNR